jgi:hypothetical protein
LGLVPKESPLLSVVLWHAWMKQTKLSTVFMCLNIFLLLHGDVTQFTGMYINVAVVTAYQG